MQRHSYRHTHKKKEKAIVRGCKIQKETKTQREWLRDTHLGRDGQRQPYGERQVIIDTGRGIEEGHGGDERGEMEEQIINRERAMGRGNEISGDQGAGERQEWAATGIKNNNNSKKNK